MLKSILCRERTWLIVVAIAGIIGLGWLAQRVTHPAAATRAEGEQVIGAEASEILIPEILITLAHDPALTQILEAPGGVRRYLEQRRVQRTWCAVLWQQRSANGQVVTTAQILHPGVHNVSSRDMPNILATIAGNPPSDPMCDYHSARVLIIPAEKINEDPPDVIAEMTGFSASDRVISSEPGP